MSNLLLNKIHYEFWATRRERLGEDLFTMSLLFFSFNHILVFIQCSLKLCIKSGCTKKKWQRKWVRNKMHTIRFRKKRTYLLYRRHTLPYLYMNVEYIFHSRKKYDGSD